jgi:hypothetical protein
VSFLDEVELALLDRTEPNYLRLPVPTVHTVELENGEMLDNAHLYRSRHGLIGSEDGDPVPAGPQHDALPIAAAALGRPVTHAQFAASADLRNELRAALAASAVKDGMDTSATVAAP